MPGQLRYNNAPQPYLFDVSAAFRNAADLINTPLRHFGEVADKITTSIQNQNTNELYRYLASQYDPNNVQSINQALARAAGDNRFSNVGADTWRQATDDYRVRQSELLNKENLALAQRAMDAYQNRINQEAANGSIAGLLAANNAGAQAMLDGKVRSDAIKYGEVDPLRTSASVRALQGANADAARARAGAIRAAERRQQKQEERDRVVAEYQARYLDNAGTGNDIGNSHLGSSLLYEADKDPRLTAEDRLFLRSWYSNGENNPYKAPINNTRGSWSLTAGQTLNVGNNQSRFAAEGAELMRREADMLTESAAPKVEGKPQYIGPYAAGYRPNTNTSSGSLQTNSQGLLNPTEEENQASNILAQTANAVAPTNNARVTGTGSNFSGYPGVNMSNMAKDIRDMRAGRAQEEIASKQVPVAVNNGIAATGSGNTNTSASSGSNTSSPAQNFNAGVNAVLNAPSITTAASAALNQVDTTTATVDSLNDYLDAPFRSRDNSANYSSLYNSMRGRGNFTQRKAELLRQPIYNDKGEITGYEQKVESIYNLARGLVESKAITARDFWGDASKEEKDMAKNDATQDIVDIFHEYKGELPIDVIAQIVDGQKVKRASRNVSTLSDSIDTDSIRENLEHFKRSFSSGSEESRYISPVSDITQANAELASHANTMQALSDRIMELSVRINSGRYSYADLLELQAAQEQYELAKQNYVKVSYYMNNALKNLPQ